MTYFDKQINELRKKKKLDKCTFLQASMPASFLKLLKDHITKMMTSHLMELDGVIQLFLFQKKIDVIAINEIKNPKGSNYGDTRYQDTWG